MNETADRRPLTWPDFAQASVAPVAAWGMLRGQPAGGWVAVLVGLSLSLIAVLPWYRQRWHERWQSAWRAAADFPHAHPRVPLPAALLLVVVPSVLFLLLRDHGVQSGDSRPVVMATASLVRTGNTELSEFVPVYVKHHLFTSSDAPPYFFLACRRGIYSHYPSGMVVFALPVVAAANVCGADLDDPTVHERLEKLTASCVSATCLGLFFLIALCITAPRPSYAATLPLAIGSVMYSTVGQALWQHGGVIFWLELLLLVEFRSFAAPTAKTIVVQAVCCGMMLACRLSAGLIVASFGIWLFIRSPRRAALLAGLSFIAVLPWAALNHWIYGSPLGPMAVQARGTFWSVSNVGAWAGILFSPTHGLLVYQPWIWLVPLAAACRVGLASLRAPAHRWRRRIRWAGARKLASSTLRLPYEARGLPVGWRWWAASVIALHLALVSSWHCWWGGWCWGSRLAAEIVPLAALLSLGPLTALWNDRRGRQLVVATALASALLHVPSVYLQQQRWYSDADGGHERAALWCWSSPPFLFPIRR
ncbi:MAG TPA: hypothetical protein VNH11_20165 [Pirellulales bacterium]|nr:hypothetical protein [Pirellulales bacterium]